MSVIWSLGASVVTECRKPFDLFLKKLFALDIKFPDIKTKKYMYLIEGRFSIISM